MLASFFFQRPCVALSQPSTSPTSALRETLRHHQLITALLIITSPGTIASTAILLSRSVKRFIESPRSENKISLKSHQHGLIWTRLYLRTCFLRFLMSRKDIFDSREPERITKSKKGRRRSMKDSNDNKSKSAGYQRALRINDINREKSRQFVVRGSHEEG